MPLTVDQIADEVRALPTEERARLADRLAALFDPVDDPELRRVWSAEALRRRDEIRSGKVQAISGEEGLARVRRAVGL